MRAFYSKGIALGALVAALAVPAVASAGQAPDAFERAAARAQASPDVFERYAAAHPNGRHALPAAAVKSSHFITDTLGGNGQPVAAKGYRFTTDTLGGNGQPVATTAADRFGWGDAGIGAGIALGGIALLSVSVALVRQRRHRLQTA